MYFKVLLQHLDPELRAGIQGMAANGASTPGTNGFALCQTSTLQTYHWLIKIVETYPAKKLKA